GNLRRIGDAILAKYRDGSWPKYYVVVTEVVVASSTTTLISSGSEAKVELCATAKVSPQGLTLANAEAKFVAKQESRMGWSTVAQGGLTPLFRACGVK